MVPVSDSSISTSSNSTSRTHRFVPTSSESADFTSPGEVEDERALPSLRGLGEMEEEAVRLSAVNMSGVILSVGCFVSLDCLLHFTCLKRTRLIWFSGSGTMKLSSLSFPQPPALLSSTISRPSPLWFQHRRECYTRLPRQLVWRPSKLVR